MSNQQTCSYQGHYCSHRVQFISRYRDQNDYCVAGNRVSVLDSGEVRRGTPAEYRAILLFELDKYAEYARWNAEHRAKYADWPQLTEFRFHALSRFLKVPANFV